MRTKSENTYSRMNTSQSVRGRDSKRKLLRMVKTSSQGRACSGLVVLALCGLLLLSGCTKTSSQEHIVQAKASYESGMTHYGDGKFEAAIADLNSALALNPKYAEAYYQRATIHFHLEDSLAAIADYGRAIKLKPHYALAYVDRGIAKQKIREYQGAKSDYLMATKLNPEDHRGYYNLACVHAINGDVEQVLHWLGLAVSLGVTNVDYILNDPDLALVKENPAFVGFMKNTFGSAYTNR